VSARVVPALLAVLATAPAQADEALAEVQQLFEEQRWFDALVALKRIDEGAGYRSDQRHPELERRILWQLGEPYAVAMNAYYEAYERRYPRAQATHSTLSWSHASLALIDPECPWSSHEDPGAIRRMLTTVPTPLWRIEAPFEPVPESAREPKPEPAAPESGANQVHIVIDSPPTITEEQPFEVELDGMTVRISAATRWEGPAREVQLRETPDGPWLGPWDLLMGGLESTLHLSPAAEGPVLEDGQLRLLLVQKRIGPGRYQDADFELETTTLRIDLERLRADSDGDGLTDEEERQWITDPARADTDGDGLLDPEDPQPLAPADGEPGRKALAVGWALDLMLQPTEWRGFDTRYPACDAELPPAPVHEGMPLRIVAPGLDLSGSPFEHRAAAIPPGLYREHIFEQTQGQVVGSFDDAWAARWAFAIPDLVLDEDGDRALITFSRDPRLRWGNTVVLHWVEDGWKVEEVIECAKGPTGWTDYGPSL
jgi:hypothetical protein